MIRGMSTRKGQVHFLEDVLDMATQIAKDKLLSDPKKQDAIKDKDRTALILAVTTLLVSDFSATRVMDYTFDIEKKTTSEKGSGAYLQYAHCRLKSIEENNASLDLTDLESIDYSVISDDESQDLIFKLSWFERVVELCLADFEPSRIVLYLMELAKTTNRLIPAMRVLNQEPEVARARLLLLKAVRIVIRNAMKVLGITPLDKM